jgi:alpha-galactosidase
MTVTIPGTNGVPVLSDIGHLIEPDDAHGLSVRHELVELSPRVYEARLTVRNSSDADVTLTRMDAFAALLEPGEWRAHWFTSAWGHEFTPHSDSLPQEFDLGTHSGRSSNGTHPWLGLECRDCALVISPAWSGNWHVTHTAGRLTAGISPWRFATTLRPHESAEAPSVVISVGASLAEAAASLAGTIGHAWIPRSAASDSMRVEWNHWWPYEDAGVSEDIIERNASLAADIGIRQITVDAGWFGPAGDTFWEDVRGDWDQVNTNRFPHGLGRLGKRIREHDAVSGIWIEAEAVGPKASLRHQHPELMAVSTAPLRDDDDTWSFPPRDAEDPGFLGYVCLGSPAGREFALEVLDRAVSSIGAEWVKLDFNLDPGGGCTRTDHGHGERDGLYRHYLGLYDVLDVFRARHPEVILESCSSGGLRLDLGLARHVHCMFLSDPDYTEHHLQVLWGAARMLPPAAMLHWSWSQWRGDYSPQKLDFDSVAESEFATTLRAAMLQRFGVSLRLPELRPELLAVLGEHVRMYADDLVDLLRFGVLVPLTAQPLRDGRGERVPVFRITDGDRHVIAATVLPGGETPTQLRTELDQRRRYRARDLVSGRALVYESGVIHLDPRRDESSWLIRLEPETDDEDDE